MTANVLEHRRAKAFAEALEAHQAEERGAASDGAADTASTGAGSAAMAGLVGMVGALGALPGPALDQGVRTVQRAQLMAAFEQAFAGGPGAAVPRQRGHRAVRTAPRGRWSRRFAIGGLVAGLAVGSLAGAAAASASALPGDTLYGMKRGLEGLRLDLADSDSERGTLLLDNAATRLGEAKSLVGRTDPAGSLSPGTVDQVRKALDDMHADALRGRDLLRSVYRGNGSLDPMRVLAGFAQDEDGHWTELQSRLPVQLTSQAHLVDQLFDDISEDVAPLRLAQPPPRAVDRSAAGRAAARAARPTAAHRPTPRPSAATPRRAPGRPRAAARAARTAARPAAPSGRRPPGRARPAAAARPAACRATRRARSAGWSTTSPAG